MTSQATTVTLSPEFERRAAIARGAIRADFGEGWMTTGARDMIRIAAFAGFDVPDLVKRVAIATKHDGMTGPRLVERVMGEMEDEAAARDEAARVETPGQQTEQEDPCFGCGEADCTGEGCCDEDCPEDCMADHRGEL